MTRFFISYTGADRDWATWIATQLEGEGHKTILQAWDFRAGASFVEEMNHALIVADRMIAVLSPAYLESEHATAEWEAVYRLDPLGKEKRLVPVQVREIDRSKLGLLGPRIAIVLVELEGAALRTALLEGIDPARQIQPDTGSGSTRSVLFDLAHGQRSWSVPPDPDDGYAHLEKLVASIEAQVRTWTDAPLPAAISLERYAAVIHVTAPQNRFRLTGDEINALKHYVLRGGGLLAMSAYTGDWHHQANLNDVVDDFGLSFNRDLVMPATATPEAGRVQVYENQPGAGFDVLAMPATTGNPDLRTLPASLTTGVDRVLTLASCSVAAQGNAEVVLRSVTESKTFVPLPRGTGYLIDRYEELRSGPADLVAVARRGEGRVAAVGGFKMFLNEFMELEGYDNARLLENLLRWLAGAPDTGVG